MQITTLNFALYTEDQVSLTVYSLQGKEVITLADGSRKAGYHSVDWNAKSHSSGMYFVKIVIGDYVNTQKLILMK